MSNLKQKDISPVAAVAANLFVLGILGYFLIGQRNKAAHVFLTAAIVGIASMVVGTMVSFVIGPFALTLFSLPAMVIPICGLIDVYQIAVALQNGQQVDENEYHFEWLYRICRFSHAEAICRPQNKSIEKNSATTA